jgi:hypothetical protein
MDACIGADDDNFSTGDQCLGRISYPACDVGVRGLRTKGGHKDND